MRRAPYIVVSIYAGFLAWVVCAFNWVTVSKLWDVDDAYFYLNIARNVARGLGSTFDGLALTNGYQPLWLALLAGALRVTRAFSADSGIRVALILASACAIWGTLIFVKLLDRLGVRPLVATASILGLLSGYAFWFFGLEAHLNVLVAGICFTMFWTRWQALSAGDIGTRRGALAMALAAAALTLTRIDLVIWSALLLLALSAGRALVGIDRRSVTRVAALEIGGSSLVVLAYLAFNRLYFGVWFPISALLRSKPLGFDLRSIWFYHLVDTVHLAILLAAAIVMIVVALRQMRGVGVRAVLGTRVGFGAVLAIGAFGHCVASILFAAAWVPRYLMTPSCAVAVVIALLLTEFAGVLSQPRRRVLNALVLVGVVGVSGKLAMLGAGRLWGAPWPAPAIFADFRQDIAPYLTRDAVAFIVDDAGEFAWFCDCHVINGDGLVNDWTYQQFVHERRIPDYLRSRRVSYIVHTSGELDPDFYVPDEQVLWVEGFDWQASEAEAVFPIVGYRAGAALAHRGRFRLFRYPDAAIFPPATGR